MFEKLTVIAVVALIALLAYVLLKPAPTAQPSQQPSIEFTTRRDGLMIKEQVYGEIPPCKQAKQAPCVSKEARER